MTQISKERLEGPLSAEELRKIDAYWRASLYLCVGMLFLLDNPLLKEPLKMEPLRSASWDIGDRTPVSLSPGCT